uniref:Uncharacterized protein n=1 Tax=Meloidogyne enterolobii TaxID=390850 RepID=A0A6V7U634_MELEN|nr:unnamed protein product [Meloidogyne enterolobii]
MYNINMYCIAQNIKNKFVTKKEMKERLFEKKFYLSNYALQKIRLFETKNFVLKMVKWE